MKHVFSGGPGFCHALLSLSLESEANASLVETRIALERSAGERPDIFTQRSLLLYLMKRIAAQTICTSTCEHGLTSSVTPVG